MLRAATRRRGLLGFGILAVVACGGGQERAPYQPPPPAVATAAPAAAQPPPWPLPDEVLHPWETALVMIDPRHLTRTMRLQRAYARRKMMMLNPDSATARVLEDLSKAAEAGEIDPSAKSESMIFTAPGVAPNDDAKPPPGGRPPAGARNEAR